MRVRIVKETEKTGEFAPDEPVRSTSMVERQHGSGASLKKAIIGNHITQAAPIIYESIRSEGGM